MEENYDNVLQFKKKSFFEKAKDLARDKVEDVKLFVQTHKEETLIFGPIVIGGLFKIGKGIVRNVNLNKEEAIKEKYWYDPSLGHYWALRRRPSQRECLEIDKRKQNGERLGDILQSMKLLR